MGLIKTVKEGIGFVVKGVQVFQHTRSEFEKLREIVFKYNSQADIELQAKNPLPAPSEPDYKQIVAYLQRALALAFEMGKALLRELKD